MPQRGRYGSFAEPLEERVLMAMSLRAGGSGFSNLLATDSAAVRQQKLIIDPPEPLAGSASVVYDAGKVTLRGAAPGPGYENQSFLALVGVRVNNTPQLQPLNEFLVRPRGPETGYVQVRYQLSGQAGKIAPPRDWLVLDVGGTEGMDTHALDFERRENVSPDVPIRYGVFAAGEGEFGPHPEDFLITNDGTNTRLGPAQLSAAEASTRPTDGSVSGTVFEDSDGDGVMDRDEQPLAGVLLFVDFDEDRLPDNGEPSTQTNELGGYFFDDLAPGTHLVTQVPPAGYLSPADARGGAYAVEVDAGKRTRGVDFADVRRATVSGTVFNDVNGDGVRERTEPGLAGALVYVDGNNNGTRDPTDAFAVSADDGTWSITGLRPGPHVVRQVPPLGFRQTAPAGGSHAVTLSSGQALGNLNFGDQRLPPPRVLGVFALGSRWSDAFGDRVVADGLGGPAGVALSRAGAAIVSLPWVNVDLIAVQFDQPVAVQQSDLLVRGQRAEYVVPATPGELSTPPHTYVFGLNRPLGGDGSAASNGDRLTLVIEGDAPSGVTGLGDEPALLDGDGDGRAGGDYVLRFNIAQGDVDRSGSVLANDFSQVKQRFFASASTPHYSVFHDVDGNGTILANDFSAVKQRFFTGLPAPQSSAAAAAAARLAPPRPLRAMLFAHTPVLR